MEDVFIGIKLLRKVWYQFHLKPNLYAYPCPTPRMFLKGLPLITIAEIRFRVPSVMLGAIALSVSGSIKSCNRPHKNLLGR